MPSHGAWFRRGETCAAPDDRVGRNDQPRSVGIERTGVVRRGLLQTRFDRWIARRRRITVEIGGEIEHRVVAIAGDGRCPSSVARDRMTADAARRSVLVEIALPSGALISRVTPDAIVRLDLAADRPVLALIKSTSIEVLGS